MLRRLMAAILLLSCPALAEVRSVPVASTTLYPGDPVVAETLVDKAFEADAPVFDSFVSSAEQVRNKVARRTIAAGQPIPLASLKPLDMIQRGQPTVAVFQSGGLLISTLLIPLEAGTAGDVVQARNPESGVLVTATVTADGTLAIAAP
ncbi:flagellar basal body P-ring formation chaperone FlgA [Aestuariivirga sp.]|uniref:flagellar basal body P-ring formation chaperone FlgA n=1 Tax=Aestuariivirga sp. TaxID=2650926 RepID=UPI0039E6F52C